MAAYIMVWTTTDSAERAEQIARAGVENRAAACAQIDGPITSVYWWEGDVTTDPEWRVLFKTPAERYEALEAAIRTVHTYDVPEIVATQIADGADGYLDWMDEETRPR